MCEDCAFMNLLLLKRQSMIVLLPTAQHTPANTHSELGRHWFCSLPSVRLSSADGQYQLPHGATNWPAVAPRRWNSWLFQIIYLVMSKVESWERQSSFIPTNKPTTNEQKCSLRSSLCNRHFMLVCVASDVVLKMKTRQSSIDKTFCAKGTMEEPWTRRTPGGRDGKISTGCDKKHIHRHEKLCVCWFISLGGPLDSWSSGAMSGNHSLCHLLYFP